MSNLVRFIIAAIIGLIGGVIYPYVQYNLLIITVGIMVACWCEWDLEFALGCFVAAVVVCLGG